MSEKLPALDGQRFVRALKRAGFLIVRVRGSAHIMRHPEGGRMVSVHVHKGVTIKRGTLAALLEDSGLTVEQLRELL
ncbi:MAG TPA: type II toxin-antitoxin system HicA family toxin [Candidatus Sulfotelmatobacter sp.]|nr:type II toxin-antitoxin system HicA family toxin [Candidatus Sulfotelmatobacter sp.]